MTTRTPADCALTEQQMADLIAVSVASAPAIPQAAEQAVRGLRAHITPQQQSKKRRPKAA